ncbi:MAG: YwiC-like family protein [Acidimicrobiales bacterium]|jgi:hypothetical protein|nr:YwiC-like family protein [Acidimicrobiales bacterium]
MTGTVTPQSQVAAGPAPGARSVWRSVALPSEHGGWGLTAEPALLGLLVAPSIPGALLAVAAMVAFLARTPLKLVLIDTRRHRHQNRTRAAALVLTAEVAVLATLVLGVVLLAESASWWWPAVIAAPLVVVELWFDMRSRSRRLVPELAGSMGIGAVVTMIVLADGGPTGLAVGLWLIVAGRALTAIPMVRSLVARIHGRTTPPVTTLLGDAAALVAVTVAVLLDAALLPGAVAVAVVVAAQRVMERRPLPPAKVLGIRQLALGLAVVAVTAVGVHLH